MFILHIMVVVFAILFSIKVLHYVFIFCDQKVQKLCKVVIVIVSLHGVIVSL